MPQNELKKASSEEDKLKIIVVAVVVTLCVAITLYFHIIGVEVVYTHLFYIPIGLASFWFGKKGFFVALILALVLLLTHLTVDQLFLNNVMRAFMFCIVGFAVGILSEARNKAENELKDYSEKLEEKVEERTRESEERFQAISKTAQDSIFIKDRTLKYTQVNPAMERLFGVPASELIGKTDDDLFDKEAGAHLREIDSRVLKGEIVEEEHTKKVKGIPFTFHIIKVPMRDSSGKIIGVCGIARDITKRKRAEEEIRESEEKFKRLFNRNPEALLYVDKDFKTIDINPQFEELFGYSIDEIKGKEIDEFIVPKDRMNEGQKLNEMSKKGYTFYETVRKKKDGTLVPVSLSAGSIISEGSMVGINVIYKDITERKQAEKELRESKNKIEQLHKVAAQMEATQSEEKVYWLTVDAAEKILEFDMCTLDVVEGNQFVVKATSSGLPMKGTVGSSVDEGGMAAKTYRTGKSYLTKDLRKEKEARPVKVEYRSGISLPIGRIGVFQAVSKEVGAFDQEDLKLGELLISHTTEALKRIRSEKALQESEEKYRSLTNQLPVGVYRTTKEGKFLHANPALATILEFESVEDFMKVSASDIYNDPCERINQIKQWKTTKEIISNELKFRTKKGREIWIRDTGHVILDENGEISYINGVIEDITERKKMEETLQEEKERYRILAEESPLGVSIIGKDGHYKYINPKFVDIFGYTLEDIPTGKEWFAKAYPDQEYRNQVISTWITDLKKSKHGKARPRIFIVRCKDGSEKVIHFRPVTIGSIDQFVIYEDITERKKAEELLKKQREELSAFAHTVSHDLKNYIGIIRNSAQFSLLKKEYAKKNNQRIIDITKKMEDFVNRQLELADAGKAIGEFEEIDLNKMIDEVEKAHSIEIHREELSMIKGDSQQLKEVFHNLIHNAIKHGKADRIEISSRKKKNNCIICVKDNGKGISGEDIDKIFNMGYSKTGTGFGLTIVKKIIEAHGGGISVKSKVGKGTTFEIVLPI